MDTAAELAGSGLMGNVTLSDNAFFGSYDTHTVQADSTGNAITRNVALGTVKAPSGNQFDLRLPSTFGIFTHGNTLTDNIAAGSDRLGFNVVGEACGIAAPRISRNHAQSVTVGMIPRAAEGGAATSCTQIHGFTTAFAWDFGLITMTGLPTDLDLIDCSFVNSKHAGVLPMRRGGMTDTAVVRYIGGSVVGATDADVCQVPMPDLLDCCSPQLQGRPALVRQLRCM
jgi:hypothetical protein